MIQQQNRQSQQQKQMVVLVLFTVQSYTDHERLEAAET